MSYLRGGNNNNNVTKKEGKCMQFCCDSYELQVKEVEKLCIFEGGKGLFCIDSFFMGMGEREGAHVYLKKGHKFIFFMAWEWRKKKENVLFLSFDL